MLGLKKIFKNYSAKNIASLQPLLEKINALEEDISALSDEALRAKTAEFKKRLADGATLDDLLPEAFAVVREAARRTLGQRHFDVQLIGGIVMHRGGIAEMKTGEGKTLVATLPAYLNALEGKGVHVVTVNDYLSRRDAVWMGQIYARLDMRVGVINHESSYVYDPAHVAAGEAAAFKVAHEFLRPCTRHEAYAVDITYGTNNEFGFDYLRDNIEYDPANLRQSGFHYAIVDEIDSILIDEARTPLIISAPTMESEDLYARFAKIADALHEGEEHEDDGESTGDYIVDEKKRAISLTDAGISKAEKLLGVENIYTEKGIKYVHHLETAVRAKALFKREKEYVVRDGQVIIVDEFTGRLQLGRRWSEGLHQAIEAKEGVVVQKETRTYASVTFQNYFRLYGKLAGMTGTALTSEEEFYKVYGLEVTAIPTNKPMVRTDLNDQIFQTELGKFKAVARRIKELNERGQPVLVGTVSIEKNELLGQFLSREGIKHEILNAKNHEREGEIVAEAGRRGAVTIATNMAGRGVDIKLGGPEADAAERQAIVDLGGLAVFGTERHEARRIDNQLRGRSGRQGDPGTTQFFVSLEDNLMRVFASDMIKNLLGRFGIPEDEPIENRIISKALETAQTKIEGLHFDARKHTLEYDDVLNFQRVTMYDRRRALLLGHGDMLRESIETELQLTTAREDLQRAFTEKKATMGEEEFYTLIRRLLLQTIDMFWIDHLEAMEYLRNSVGLRGYGQRDPLVEYKRESLRLFKEMEQGIIDQVFSVIPTLSSAAATALSAEERQMRDVQKQAQLLGGSATATDAIRTQNPTVMAGAVGPEPLGRNEKIFVTKHGVEKEIKFKRLEQYLAEGWTIKK